jgi:hypothetical protein
MAESLILFESIINSQLCLCTLPYLPSDQLSLTIVCDQLDFVHDLVLFLY